MEEQQCSCEKESTVELLIDPLLIGTDNLAEVEFDADSFIKGLHSASFLAGQITGLINVGITPEEALGYFMNKEILANNLEITKISNKTSIEVAKHTAIQADKNSL